MQFYVFRLLVTYLPPLYNAGARGAHGRTLALYHPYTGARGAHGRDLLSGLQLRG